ncbi:PepSY domain-containing protein [Sporosarcina luteola]|uniref:PepSY domain-containing protein n=1 Tax=Sporosarcina luteola TaxID=582850 RepID=UPI00203C1285|nr:PepSY domain-containing protein [Sporosarcina luteola]MCM3636230.1 PepSY domain-containing protein [Sporosarcina luteola]
MKKWMLIPAVAGVLAIGGVALAEDSVPSVAKQAEKMISLQEAKQVATEKVKGGIVTEIELDKDDGRYHFDVDLKDGKYEYDLEVDAVTGEIIKFEKEADKNHKQVKSDKLLTKEEAIAIAKKRAFGIVKEIELDEDDGRKEYDIEMRDGEFKYEIELDAVTGEFLEFEKERYQSTKKEVKVQPQDQVKVQTEKVAASTLKVVEPTTEKQAVKLDDNKKPNKKTMLTKEQVIAIAKQHASGVVTDFELDDNVYEIEMEDGDIEYELDIDAFTGAILSFERDDD